MIENCLCKSSTKERIFVRRVDAIGKAGNKKVYLAIVSGVHVEMQVKGDMNYREKMHAKY